MTTQASVRRHTSGNPVKGALFLTGILFGLIWFPLVGPFVAGLVGGLNSGSVPGALIAWVVPTSLIGFFVVLLAGMSPMGINYGFLAIVVFHMCIVLVGALAGGIAAANKSE
jgi:hypothetical protein